MAAAADKHPLRVLIVEDNPDDHHVYQRYLQADPACEYAVVTAECGADGLAEFAANPPDCILLDFNLPDMDGLEFLAALFPEGEDPPVAIAMLTGQGNERVAVEAMKRGVHDYLVKSDLDAEGMRRTIVSAMDNVRYRRQRDSDRQGLERMAFYDPLTGLGNRNLFRDRLSHALEVAKRNHYDLGLLLKIIDSVSRPIVHEGEAFTVGASIGIAMFPEHGDDHDSLVYHADAAMYRAKRSGGGFAVSDGGAVSAPRRRAS